MTDVFIVRGVSIAHNLLSQVFFLIPERRGWLRWTWEVFINLPYFCILPLAITLGTSVRSPLRLEELLGVGYVNQEHGKRAALTARIMGPDPAPSPGGAVVGRGELRAAHRHAGS